MDFRALKCTTFSCVVSSNAIKTNMVRYLVLKQFIEAKETLKQFCNFSILKYFNSTYYAQYVHLYAVRKNMKSLL